MGSSVSMQFYSSCGKLGGIALCVVLEFEDDYVDHGLINDTLKSDHLFAWDDPCFEASIIDEENWTGKYSEASFAYRPDSEQVQNCKVVHQLLGESIDSRTYNSNEEEESYPKGLKCLED
ncbi:hypothetical protein GH714_016023 [Hevea brasiliensis]|uniref:Uncharacterized protein n=1 Tax=Hevea brasiliensis TaxID=3981 RepID=A0A6A6KPK0_HEVBR|nr:hypothetical protein GH714_016023 [Hevea brasiliensis]